MLRFSSNDALLHKAMEDLLANWDETASTWRDQARQEFGERYLDELQPLVKGACNSMKDIYTLLRREAGGETSALIRTASRMIASNTSSNAIMGSRIN